MAFRVYKGLGFRVMAESGFKKGLWLLISAGSVLQKEESDSGYRVSRGTWLTAADALRNC